MVKLGATKQFADLAYLFVVFVALILGVALGGILVDKTGGIRDKNSYRIMVVFTMLTVITGIL